MATPRQNPSKNALATNLKVAIVHDWLVGGGAERVVYELHCMFPDAPVYTSYATDSWRQKLDGKVITGFLQHWPFSRLRKYIGMLRIWWFSRLDLSQYDLVISSTGNGEAFGIRVPKSTKHICYCHSPTHYYWRHYETYMAQPGFGFFDPLVRVSLKLLVGPLRRWDYKAAQRPDVFIANSSHIQKDIKTYYGRDSKVIFPPVDVERFSHLPQQRRHGFVTVGRQVPHKHTGIIVEACTRLQLPLTVIGQGSEHEHLVHIAGPSVTFIDSASDSEVASYLGTAEAFIFASFDDFGITPIEAMAAGTPVIAFKAGGALDYIETGKTGLFFTEQTADSLCLALEAFTKENSFDHAHLQSYAAQFAPAIFRSHMQSIIQTSVKN